MTNNFYNIIDKLEEFLSEGPFTNTVTFGDVSDVDLSKTTIFPLAHINVDNVSITGPTVVFTVNLLVMDVVDFNSNEGDADDIFYGNDNTQDILNTQLSVLQRLAVELTRGSLKDARLNLIDNSLSAQPFKDRFKNVLAGYASTIQFEVPNTASLDANC